MLEILKESKPIDGIYVSAEVSKESKKALKEYSKQIGISVEYNDYHTTLSYSDKPSVSLVLKRISEILPKSFKPSLAKGFKRFDDAIVLELIAPELCRIHKRLNSKFDLKYDYDEYTPHITLMYGESDIDIDNIPLPDFEIEFSHYKIEPINKD